MSMWVQVLVPMWVGAVDAHGCQWVLVGAGASWWGLVGACGCMVRCAHCVVVRREWLSLSGWWAVLDVWWVGMADRVLDVWWVNR